MPFFRSIIIFPCTVAILLADAGSFLAAAEAPPTVRTELRVAAIDIVGEHHTLWLRTGAGSEPVKLQLNVRTFTEKLQYEGTEKSGVYTTEADARAEAPAQPPLLTLRLSGGSKMFVFLPDGASYRALTIPEGDFPYGSIRSPISPRPSSTRILANNPSTSLQEPRRPSAIRRTSRRSP